MICPYCVEYIPAGSIKHSECNSGQEFSPFYRDHHGGQAETEPIVLSVIGFSGHGKTVFLCALFHYLDRCLTKVWPGFSSDVLDQESLNTLSINREKLEERTLPPITDRSFPRPGIFRLTDMPCGKGENLIPFLEDTTLLIYDPPGAAFSTESRIVEFAPFVKRSRCVLFLIDLTSLGNSIASKMEKLLETYVLGLRRMEIEKRSQHLIVVYTKSDDMKVSVPHFSAFLRENPEFEEYLNEQLPQSLSNPSAHLARLDHNSRLLEGFTQSKLDAQKFINLASKWFASVSYTAVSSLGAAPEKVVNEAGAEVTRLAVEMSPRSVADPLLYVLAKSERVRRSPPPWWRKLMTKTGILALSAVVVLLTALIYFFFFYNADFRRAAACSEQQDYPCAIQNYSNAISNYPKYADAYGGRGWAFLESERYEEAFADCNKALQLKTGFAEALVCRGRAYSWKLDYDNGLKDCEQAVGIKPGYAAAYQCRGFIYWYQSQNEKAIRDYDRAIELKPDFGRAYFNRAIAYADSGNTELALRDRQKATELAAAVVIEAANQEHTLAYDNRGRSFVNRGQYRDAILDFTKAIYLKPDFVKAYEGRGSAYFSLHEYEQGIPDFGEIIRLRPNDAGAYISRGDAYFQNGNYDKAIDDYSKGIDLQPDSPDNYFKRAEAYMKLRKFVEAIADYDDVITIDPERVDAYFSRGNAHLAHGDYRRHNVDDYDLAVRDFEHVATEREDDAESKWRAGIANARRNNYALSIADYEEAIRRDPDFESKEDPYYSLMYYRRGLEFKETFDNEPGDECRKAYALAASDFQKATQLHPKNPRAARKLSEIEEKLRLGERCALNNDPSLSPERYSDLIAWTTHVEVDERQSTVPVIRSAARASGAPF